jgi:AcrR family transcriptional regulator
MTVTVPQAGPKKQGLRERKKQRTRRTIVRVAFELFTANGYHATTLAEIADSAEVSASTLHAYFPAKDDILFHVHDAVIAAARIRLLERNDSESLIDALQAWVEDLPALADTDSDSLRRRRTLIDGDESLQALERLRHARLEDVFAEAFASDLGETADDLRSRLMASVTLNGLRAIWFWWYRRHTEGDLDVREPFELDATYLTRLVKAAEAAIEDLPMPEDHFSKSGVSRLSG